MAEVINERYEFVLLFDVVHGNPNGDPDAGNAPRVDPETGIGLVTDVCLKRKIRNYVAITRGMQPPYDIYVKERGILAAEQKRAYQALGVEPGDRPNNDARKWMCANYYDIRTFGAVMSTGKTEENEADKKKGGRKISKAWNCGQVRGPVQLTFAQSQAPILTLEHSITRTALTNATDTERTTTGEEGEKAATGQMGRKHTIPYALYRAHGFISPHLARDTGFSRDDLDLLFEALANMLELDRSAARGEMTVRGLYVFEHESALGNAPANELFDLIRVSCPHMARSFSQCSVKLPKQEELPKELTFIQYVPK